MSTRLHTWSIVSLILVLVALAALAVPLASCGGESKARAYAANVHVTLDATTVEDMMNQMPSDMVPDTTKTPAGYREWSWRFDDGSSMVFSFRAAGGEGSQQGLVLDHVELKD